MRAKRRQPRRQVSLARYQSAVLEARCAREAVLGKDDCRGAAGASTVDNVFP
jgi:hypothetical protein